MRESTPVRGRIRCESSVSPEHSLPQQIDYSECALPSPLSSPHIIESAGERVGVMFAVVPYQSSSGLATKTASAMNIIRVDPLDAAADRILEGWRQRDACGFLWTFALSHALQRCTEALFGEGKRHKCVSSPTNQINWFIIELPRWLMTKCIFGMSEIRSETSRRERELNLDALKWRNFALSRSKARRRHN